MSRPAKKHAEQNKRECIRLNNLASAKRLSSLTMTELASSMAKMLTISCKMPSASNRITKYFQLTVRTDPATARVPRASTGELICPADPITPAAN